MNRELSVNCVVAHLIVDSTAMGAILALHSARSIKGPRRPTNEDRFAVCPDLGLYLVTDGVGGEANGLQAATTVAEFLPTLLSACIKGRDFEAKRFWSSAVRELHRRCGADDPERRSQATLVAVLLDGNSATIAHLGDSRAYLYREQTLTRLTKDHTLAQLLVDTGEIESAELETSPHRSQLTRCIGMTGCPAADVRSTALLADDHLFLCSDGVTSMLSDKEISAILSSAANPSEAVERLLARAVDRGGHDNITAIVVRGARDSA